MRDPRNHVGQTLLREGERPKIVTVDAAHLAKADVVRNERGRNVFGELRKIAKIDFIERVGAADGERHTVEKEVRLGADLFHNSARTPAATENVFGDDLCARGERFAGAFHGEREPLLVVNGAKPDAESLLGD
jgi:hypothetical protein